MSVITLEWSAQEEKIARHAFDAAYRRELHGILEQVRQVAATIASPDDLWQLHDFLSAKRHEMDGKYDYRSSMLVFVFADLIKGGWMSLDELKGIDEQKLSKISALTRM
ncbi:MAG: hypothetical protein ACO3NK_13080 [Prochlorotrichaceae cyanobacterium]